MTTGFAEYGKWRSLTECDRSIELRVGYQVALIEIKTIGLEIFPKRGTIADSANRISKTCIFTHSLDKFLGVVKIHFTSNCLEATFKNGFWFPGKSAGSATSQGGCAVPHGAGLPT
jgi:hypothetical protein